MVLFSASTLLLVIGLYLLLLMGIAHAGNRGWLPQRLMHHPLTYVLSLCVYTSAWTIYASIGYAYRYGFNFLTFFLGVSGLFLLASIFLVPIFRVTRRYQLASVADLLAFRYRSRRAGAMTTLLLLLAMVPLMALQLRAVATSIKLLSGGSAEIAALGFALLILVVTFLFGEQRLSPRQKNPGLVTAIAFESLLKILAFALVALAGFFTVFHGVDGFSAWIAANPQMIQKMYAPLQNGTWHSLILAFFVAVIVMPHMFHMAFSENTNANNLITASWALPLLMFIMALCVPFILWAAIAGHAPTQPDYFMLGVGMIVHPSVALLAFLAGVASASGMLVVTILALSSMCLNHLVLPFTRSRPLDDIYGHLTWLKRLFVTLILLASFGFMQVDSSTLTGLGVLSFVGALQFVPGLVGLLLWPGANRSGFLAGLTVGFAIWLFALFLPSLGVQWDNNPLLGLFHEAGIDTLERRYNVGIVSLVANTLVMVVVSLVVRTRADERQAAEACALDSVNRTQRWALKATTVDDFRQALQVPLGPVTTQRELQMALDDLSLDQTETRPYALRRLRDQLESNLSGLLGPSTAYDVISTHLPYRKQQADQAEDMQLIESRIEVYRDRLSGLAAELDSLRRFHRQTLLELPMGVISLSNDNEVIGWNRAMESLTGITGLDIIGARLDDLPPPWGGPLLAFSLQEDNHNPRCALETPGGTRWLNLHKSRIRGTSANVPSNGLVIVVEDITELRALEDHLTHNERLASIGRLAAGVAHEIGNPVTAIDCLAQNLQYSLPDVDTDEVEQNMQQVMQQTRRISRIVQSLVTFSHSGQTSAQPQRLPVSLQAVVNEAIDLLRLDADYRDQVFVNQLTTDLVAAGDSQRLLQVFINLLGNAGDASESSDAITLTGGFLPKKGKLYVDVVDQGHGIKESLQNTLFEPFVTSKAPGKGTGLGLALVYSIIKEHEGSIEVISPLDAGRGTCFHIELLAATNEDKGIT